MPATRAATKPAYDVHPGVAMVKKSIAGRKEKTGSSLEEMACVSDANFIVAPCKGKTEIFP